MCHGVSPINMHVIVANSIHQLSSFPDLQTLGISDGFGGLERGFGVKYIFNGKDGLQDAFKGHILEIGFSYKVIRLIRLQQGKNI